MPYFLLEITAKLRKIAQLEPNNGVNDEKMPYFFTMKCENCGEVSKEVCTHVDTMDTYNGECANLLLECQVCERIGTVNLITGYGAPLTRELAKARKYVPLMLFRCDGLVPNTYVFNGGWKVTLRSGAVIEDCNLLRGKFIAELGEEAEEGEEDEEDGEDEDDEEDEEDEEDEDDGEDEVDEEDDPIGPPRVLNARGKFTQYWNV